MHIWIVIRETDIDVQASVTQTSLVTNFDDNRTLREIISTSSIVVTYRYPYVE